MADPVGGSGITSGDDDREVDENDLNEVIFHSDEATQEAAREQVDAAALIAARGEQLPQAEQEMAQLPADGAAPDEVQFHDPPDEDPQEAQAADNLVQGGQVVQQQVAAAAATPNCYDSNLCKFLSATAALVTVIWGGKELLAALIGATKSARMARAVTAGDPGEPGAGADIQKAIEVWKRPTEADYWTNLATFADNAKPRPYQEQLLFMQLTVHFANHLMPASWQWSRPSEQLQLVHDLADRIQRDGLGTVYRVLPTLRCGPSKSLPPRAVLGDLMSRALTRWYANYA